MDQIDLEIDKRNDDKQSGEHDEGSAEPATLVAKLRARRIEQKMTVSDLADRLCLSVEIIKKVEALEPNSNNDVFTRGYIRSYARFVKLSNEELEQGLLDLGIASKKTSPIVQLGKFGVNKQSTLKDKPVRFTTYFVILFLMLSIVAWWFSYNTKENNLLRRKTFSSAQSLLEKVQEHSSASKENITIEQKQQILESLHDNQSKESMQEASSLSSGEHEKNKEKVGVVPPDSKDSSVKKNVKKITSLDSHDLPWLSHNYVSEIKN